MKKKLVFGLMIAAVLLSMTPTAFAINQTDAEKIALEYKHDDESLKIYGPYTYGSSSYYVAEFYQMEGNLTQSVLIINEKNGKILKDEETTKKIMLTHFFVGNNNVFIKNHENLSEIYNGEVNISRKNVQVFENEPELVKGKDFKKVIEIEKKATDTYINLSETIFKISVLEKKIETGNKSYENVIEIRKLNDEYISLLEDLLKMDEEYKMQLTEYYDFIGSTPEYNVNQESWSKSREEVFKAHEGVIENRKNELELEKENREICEEYISFTVESSGQKTSDSKVPGFSLLFAVCSIVIVVVLVKRRK